MIKLRLKKYGRKGQACYRIVAMDSRSQRDGASIEELGFYNPITGEIILKLKKIRTRLNQGAKPTETVFNILIKSKHFFVQRNKYGKLLRLIPSPTITIISNVHWRV